MLLNRLSLQMFPPQAVLLAADVVLMAVSKTEQLGSRFPAESAPPYGTVNAETSLGPIQIAVCRFPLGDDEAKDEQIEEHFTKLFGLAPLFVGSDVTDIAVALDDATRVRLLHFLLGFCKKAFDLGADADFARSCLSLARLIVSEPLSLTPVAMITEKWTVATGFSMDAGSSCWSVSPTRVRRLSVYRPEYRDDLRITERLNPGDVVLALGDQVRMWTVGSVQDGFGDLIRSDQRADRLRAACLRVLVPNCAVVAATLRERALLSPATAIRHDDFRRPIAGALEAAISDGEGNVFLRGWLYDPLSMISSMELCGLAGTTMIQPSQLHRFFRPDLEPQLAMAAFVRPGAKLGFVALIDDSSAGLSLQPTLLLRLISGKRMALRPALQIPTATEARSAVLTSVHPTSVTDVMLETCLGPAAAAFHRSSFIDRGIPEIIQIGEQIAEPKTSVVIPLYRNLSFLRFQLAAFACDKSLRNSELVYILDSPEQRQEAEHLLRGLYAMHDIPILLVIMSRNLGYAAASNAGAAVARAPTLLLLNSDIVPERTGWLEKLHNALEVSGVGAVGPKLLFDDGSIQHAGLFFQRDLNGAWLNAHYHKGMPRRWPAAELQREVPGLTGAAILVTRADFETVGGVCEDFIIGDYEDSDFCLRIRELGKTTVYVPKAELFHFERRSIGLHAGYSGTLACRYNQQLHHSRWSDTIEKLSSTSLNSYSAPAVLA